MENILKQANAKPKKRVLYHATPLGNLLSILDKGIEPRNVEGVVYCCEKPEDCLKFAKVRGVTDALVCKIAIWDSGVFETFDHSYEFFKCQCFGVGRTIKLSEITDYFRYKDF